MVGYRIPLATTIGVIIGILLHQNIGKYIGGEIYRTGNYVLTIGDIITIAIGLILLFVGSKVHSFVKWMGLGIFLGALSMEIVEVYHYYKA